jgi:hypothetical protein
VNLGTLCANLDPRISSRCSSTDLSPSTRIFVELPLVNWRRPWGSRRLDFVIRAGSINFSIGDISKFFLHHQDQQISRLPVAAARSLQQIHPLQIDFIINKEEFIKLRDYGVDKSSRR